MPLTGAKPVIAPSRGCANHQFTGGYDFYGSKNKLSSEFTGRLAIDWLEKTCREKTKVSIAWSESGQHIGYYGYRQLGFVPLGNNCYFSSNMMRFAIENSEEGWVIATDDYLAELMALEGYYPLIEPGNRF